MQTKDIREFEAGKWVQRLEYKSFMPNKINLQWLVGNPVLQNLLSEANRHIGRLDAFSELIPNIDYFIKMHVTKEATVSSKIEGTQTSFEEALVKESDINPEKRDDWKEVHSYIQAVNDAIAAMEKLPISTRLIRQTHEKLLQGVRGKDKMPGEYRSSQNWIGGSLKNAVFVPPAHDEIPDLMHDLEQFINAEIMESPVRVPHLVKIAIIHYQFETIHPFLDGNGRIGRLLITLYLHDKKILSHPTLYLSDFFERNRAEYYDRLMRVRTHNELEPWVQFFLEGVLETACKSINTFQNIIKLRNDVELNKLITLGRKQQDARKLVNELYKQPITDGAQIAETLQVHASTANRLITDLVQLGVLTELTGYKRNRIYSFEPYIKLF
ncbi:cell filamentation protein Fic [Arachidicoccus ginsenosidimutans]|uniref:Fic family protein n=1 Tax=Arachidicoccus sp. BS20 TaxID=1850526 RepID=UPI0007F0AB7C|nr:Fic family protein [Arachidicoccus sp. BS20]ANI90754.1 cell filamentation protein Fic [Arachidicoccus sp. BS20]